MRQNSFFCLFLMFISISSFAKADQMVVEVETADVFLTHGGVNTPHTKLGTLCFGDIVSVVTRKNGWAFVHPPTTIKYERDAFIVDRQNQALVLPRGTKDIFLLDNMIVSTAPRGDWGIGNTVSKKTPPIGSLKKWGVFPFKSTHKTPEGDVVYLVDFPEDIVVAIKEGDLGFQEEYIPGSHNTLDSVVVKKQKTKNKKQVVDQTTTIQSVVNEKLLSLNKQFEKMKKENLSIGVVQELWGHYKNLKESGSELDPLSHTMISVQKNMDYIKLLYETMVEEREVSKKFTTAQQISEDVFVQGQGLKGGKTYIGEGIVSLSSVYNGKTKPKLFRLLHTETRRTIGYMEPSKKFDFISLLGQRVGIVGLTKTNPILGVKVLRPKQIDLLGNKEKKQKPINPYELMVEKEDIVDKKDQTK